MKTSNKSRFARLVKSSAVAGVFALGVVPALCSAGAGVLTDDSYTFSKSPTKNNGSAADIRISPTENAYVNFNLNTPAGYTGTNVAKAILKIFVSYIKPAGNLVVGQITSAWTEEGITFASAPATGGFLPVVAVGQAKKSRWVEVDVTSLVQAWIDNNPLNPNFGLILQSDSGLAMKVNSKENGKTSHEPSLEVNWANGGAVGTGVTGPQGPEGPQGPQGPTGIVKTFNLLNIVGDIPAGETTFNFHGPTANIQLTATQRVTATVTAVLGTQSGTAAAFDYNLCYQLLATPTAPEGPVTLFDNRGWLTATATSIKSPFTAAQSVVPGSNNSFKFGFCTKNTSATAIDNNDWVTGWVMVTN